MACRKAVVRWRECLLCTLNCYKWAKFKSNGVFPFFLLWGNKSDFNFLGTQACPHQATNIVDKDWPLKPRYLNTQSLVFLLTVFPCSPREWDVPVITQNLTAGQQKLTLQVRVTAKSGAREYLPCWLTLTLVVFSLFLGVHVYSWVHVF